VQVHNEFDIGGSVVKEDERYVVTDNPLLKNLVVSKTILNPQQATTGHSHPDQEEVYFFMKGSGVMIIQGQRFPVRQGSIVLVEDGEFHKVLNNAKKRKLEFVCIFNGKRTT
jgi:mannose-6-phosphate isomerase-like protein (cupin superfamily)